MMILLRSAAGSERSNAMAGKMIDCIDAKSSICHPWRSVLSRQITKGSNPVSSKMSAVLHLPVSHVAANPRTLYILQLACMHWKSPEWTSRNLRALGRLGGLMHYMARLFIYVCMIPLSKASLSACM